MSVMGIAMALLRSRVPVRSSESTDSSALLFVLQDSIKDNANKRTGKTWIRRYGIRMLVLLSMVFYYFTIIVSGDPIVIASSTNESLTSYVVKAPIGDIVYGAKSKGDDTARYVTEAIQAGFRHIATVSLSLVWMRSLKNIHVTIIDYRYADLFLGWISL